MTLTEVFEGNIKDIYHAEKQLTKALPKLVKKATDADLKQTLESHLGETEEHISRLEQVAEMLGIKPRLVPAPVRVRSGRPNSSQR